MVIGIVRKAVWPVGPALIELIAFIEPSTLGIWRIVPDMCPVGIQMLLEGCQAGRANHVCGECIPAVHDPHRKCRSPHPAFGPRLLDLERVAPSGTSFDERIKYSGLTSTPPLNSWYMKIMSPRFRHYI